MSVSVIHQPGATEDQIIDEMSKRGFEAVAKELRAAATEPHQHEYDVCLYILEGEFRLRDVERSMVHRFGPGDKAFVDRGTVHSEEHGPLRLIVGRRH